MGEGCPESGGKQIRVKPKQLFGHVLGVLVAGLGVVLVAGPLLRMAALEVETLVVNLYEQQSSSLEVLPLLRNITLWGPLPWLVLVGLAVGYRIAAPTGVRNPLVGLPVRARQVLRLASVLLCGVGSVPLAVALASWIALEAYDWVEWLYDLNPTMEAIFLVVPPLFLPGAWLLSWRLSGWALSRERVESNPGRIGRLVQPLGRFAAAVLVTASCVVGCAAAPQMSRIVRAPSAHSFESHCGGCHFRTAALNFKKTPEAWNASLATMQGLAGGTIPPDDLERVEDWLVAVRSRTPSEVFHTRCSRCHGLSHRSWEPRAEEDWSMLVDRIGRWSPVFYGPEIRTMLTEELVRRHGDEDADLGLGDEAWQRSMNVARRCSPCHSMSWNADRYREGGLEEALPLVRRMNQKMVDPMTEDEVEELAKDYLELLSDPDRFDRLFPHDRPLPEPGEEDYVDRRPERGGHY